MAERLRKVALENPELTYSALAERFGVSLGYVKKHAGRAPPVRETERRNGYLKRSIAKLKRTTR
ncbi:MAG: hypothetical protein SFW67_28425 [Myxococcaceae bacterium]|nr:hypothetical protein [Myxococcaceae bacterium]